MIQGRPNKKCLENSTILCFAEIGGRATSCSWLVSMTCFLLPSSFKVFPTENHAGLEHSSSMLWFGTVNHYTMAPRYLQIKANTKKVEESRSPKRKNLKTKKMHTSRAALMRSQSQSRRKSLATSTCDSLIAESMSSLSCSRKGYAWNGTSISNLNSTICLQDKRKIFEQSHMSYPQYVLLCFVFGALWELALTISCLRMNQKQTSLCSNGHLGVGFETSRSPVRNSVLVLPLNVS